ncbi:MAG: hypothetical protein J7L99_01375 [Planctomycetes bacterium]|nr:hypothetical protein [Planctomycetota bacterium]
MKSLIAISIVMLLPMQMKGAGIFADLKVADRQVAEPSKAYRYAELTIKNRTDKTIETVWLKPGDIGMRIRYSFTVPPRAIGKRFILLPATAPLQDYIIIASSATGEKIGRCSATITWPARLIATDEFIDESYKPFFDDVAKWSIRARRNYALILTIYVLFVIGTLLIGRGKIRLAVIIVIILAGTSLMIMLVSNKASKLIVHRYQLRIFNTDGVVLSECFNVISSLKTRDYTFRDNFLAHPVWQSASEARDDDVLFIGDDKTLRMRVTPGKVRIIKVAPCPMDLRADGISKPTDIYKGGIIRKEDSYYIIKTKFLTKGAALLCNDSVWLIESQGQNIQMAKVEVNSAITQTSFIQKLHQREKANLAKRLFSYWRWKYQQANKYYLVRVHNWDDEVYMEVVSLKIQPDSNEVSMEKVSEGKSAD